jgi:hypothetical protein
MQGALVTPVPPDLPRPVPGGCACGGKLGKGADRKIAAELARAENARIFGDEIVEFARKFGRRI